MLPLYEEGTLADEVPCMKDSLETLGMSTLLHPLMTSPSTHTVFKQAFLIINLTVTETQLFYMLGSILHIYLISQREWE